MYTTTAPGNHALLKRFPQLTLFLQACSLSREFFASSSSHHALLSSRQKTRVGHRRMDLQPSQSARDFTRRISFLCFGREGFSQPRFVVFHQQPLRVWQLSARSEAPVATE